MTDIERYLSPYKFVSAGNSWLGEHWYRIDFCMGDVKMKIYKDIISGNKYRLFSMVTSEVLKVVNVSLTEAKLMADQDLITKGYILCSEEQWEHLKLLR